MDRKFNKRWRYKAACAIEGPNDAVFFFTKGRPQKPPPYMIFCGTCPVARECLATGLANKHKFGVWGGVPALEFKSLPNQIREDLVAWYREVDDPLPVSSAEFLPRKIPLEEYLEGLDKLEFSLR